MTQPINLNKYRKARLRDEKQAQAEANTVKFGRTKAERLAETAAARKARQALDGHERE